MPFPPSTSGSHANPAIANVFNMTRSRPSLDALLILEADRIVQTLKDEASEPGVDVWRLSADLTVETNTQNGVVFTWSGADIESILRVTRDPKGGLTAAVADEDDAFVPLNDTDRRDWLELLSFIAGPLAPV